MSPSNIVYIIDSSSLIFLRRNNPIDIYKTPWRRLKELIEENRLITHSEVKKEIIDGNDLLVEWFKEQDREFDWVYNITDYQNAILPKIHKKYPLFIKPENEHDADPFIIALACERINTPKLQATLYGEYQYVVISDENSAQGQNLNNPYEVVKIPDFCKIFKIECIKIFEMFRRESWEF
jgi:hypothetical protein